MAKKNNVESLINKHFNQMIDKLSQLAPETVFDDIKYEIRVITPSYIALCASISGLNVIVPSAKERYTEAMYTVRNDYLYEQDGGVKVKEGSKDKLVGLIKSTFDLNKLGKGIMRWVMNKILNVIFFLLSVLMTLIYFAKEVDGGSFVLGFIIMLISGGILFYETRSNLVYPYSKKVNKFKREHLIALIVHTLSYPLITMGIDSIGSAMFFLSLMFLVFLKYDGETTLQNVYTLGKGYIITHLLFALVGAVAGFYLSYGGTFSAVLTLSYLCASLVFGLVISTKMRKAKQFVGTEWETEEDKQTERMIRSEEEKTGIYRTNISVVSGKNIDAFITRTLARLMDVALAIPIGIIMIPFFTYHLILKIVRSETDKVTANTQE